jgi:hypothetical protein
MVSGGSPDDLNGIVLFQKDCQSVGVDDHIDPRVIANVADMVGDGFPVPPIYGKRR